MCDSSLKTCLKGGIIIHIKILNIWTCDIIYRNLKKKERKALFLLFHCCNYIFLRWRIVCIAPPSSPMTYSLYLNIVFLVSVSGLLTSEQGKHWLPGKVICQRNNINLYYDRQFRLDIITWEGVISRTNVFKYFLNKDASHSYYMICIASWNYFNHIVFYFI